MEENHEHKYGLERHPIMKYFLLGLLALIGAFLAFYVVTDWYFKAMLNPVNQMKRMDKVIEKRDREMEKAFKKAFQGTERLQERANHVIRLDQSDYESKVLADLVPLNANETTLSVKTNGNRLTVKAVGLHGFGDRKSLVEFTQSYMFGDDVDLAKLTKERKDEMYIITIPINE